MNLKRVALAALACWLLYMLLSYGFHGVLLRPTYLKYGGAMRAEAQGASILPIGFAAALAAFFAFAYAFAKGFGGGGGIADGLRFGLLIATMICGFGLVWEYMVWPMGPRLFGAWVVDAFVEFAIYGIVTALIYKPLPGVARRATV
ncbi:MAG: hypothetical protein ABJC89_03560 [Acidobacteriota bacterium]